jgi:CHRD domain/LysR substrate binding domain
MCREQGFEPDVAFETEDVAMAQPLVSAGLAVALLPALSLLPLQEGVAVVPLDSSPPARSGSPSRRAAGFRLPGRWSTRFGRPRNPLPRSRRSSGTRQQGGQMRTTMLLAALAAGSILIFSAANAGARKPVTRTFHIALSGEVESPAGDPVATGTATLRLRAGQSKVCYQLSAKNLPRAVAAHIHKGKAGVAGNVVVPLKTPNAAGKSKGCAKASKALVRSMIKSPRAYYVNIHTAEFPAGAIRGQLKGSSGASGKTITRTLNGTSEPNATGSVVLRFRQADGLVCFRLTAANVTLPTVAAHIHKGAAGTNGGVVVPLAPPDANGTADGCTSVDQSLMGEILGNLSGYYVNVHTKEHPGGAIRAQLA